MAVTLSVELTDLEYAALAHIAVDPHDWFQDMVKLRCRNTIAEVANNKIKEMIADPAVASIPADKDVIFQTMIDAGELKSLSQMSDEETERTRAMVTTMGDLMPDTPALNNG